MTLVLDGDEEEKSGTVWLDDVYKSNEEIIAEIEAGDSTPEDTKAAVNANIQNGRWFSDDLDAHFNTPSLW